MSPAALLAFSPFGFDTPLPVVLLGSIVGLTYGLLGVGLVIIYRTNRVINFAHGEIGLFAAAVFGLAVSRWHVPYYIGLVLALLLGAGVGAVSEVAVVRRLRAAPRVMSIVATLGVGQFLLALGFAVNNEAKAGSGFPQPPFLPTAKVGALTLTRPYMAMLIFGPMVVVALAVFFRRSRWGLGIRAAAANPEAARMSGVFAGRMSALAWALAGSLSAFTAILVLPTAGFTASGAGFGPSLLLRALTAAVIGRMKNLPAALVGGIGLGIIEQSILWNFPRSGFVSLVLFVVIVVALTLQRREVGREEEKGSWAAVQAWRPVAEELRNHWMVRRLGAAVAVVALLLSGLVAWQASNSSATILVHIVGYAVVGLAVGIVTGLGGQLTLGQFAVGAVGAVASTAVMSRTDNFGLALLYAAAAGAIASLAVGLPSLRVRGLMITVTTLSFALVVQSWGLQQPWAFGAGVEPGRPRIGDTPIETAKGYFVFSLLVLIVAMWLARNIRRGGFGRLLVAVRDNEANARAFSVRASMVKVQAFCIAGVLAGVGGALIAHSLSRVSGSTFPIDSSINVVAMTVIGGISILSGPLLGALYVIGVPEFVELDAAGLAATQAGWLILILYLPGGLAQLMLPVRDRLVALIAHAPGRGASAENDPAATPLGSGIDVSALRRHRANTSVQTPDPLLEARDLARSFGGVKAVNGVSLQVWPGETVGLIGPNGAGKTTLFELLGGFTEPDSGTVTFAGRDVTGFGPEIRAQLGMIRSFQDAALFPTMTVLDAVHLAFERVSPTRLADAVLGFGRTERAKAARARELVGLMGLHGYRHSTIGELSTGTRRITEIACLIALQPRLLLLDEPASGIAQRETEALGGLLHQLREELALTLLVIEHDIPLIMSISDRVIAMDAGRVLAVGSPQEVRNDPRVVEAYLGGSMEAIERSGNRDQREEHADVIRT
ncbi:MAG TPA: ATP-binding cassette domain-containing protein [Acidimicrobiales bacterium]|nr:ATP-binding cassette domain-containing protein [Acidimicrobiales bacterium]